MAGVICHLPRRWSACPAVASGRSGAGQWPASLAIAAVHAAKRRHQQRRHLFVGDPAIGDLTTQLMARSDNQTPSFGADDGQGVE